MKREVVTLAAIILSASFGFAEVVHKKEFYIHIPDNWVEIPKSEIEDYARSLSEMAPEVERSKCTYVFQIQSDHWFAEPFITVVVDNSGRISKQELENVRRESLDSSLKKKFGAYVNELKAKVGSPVYDKERNILWTTIQISPDQPALVASAVFLTEKGMITLSSACSSDEEFMQFAQIVGSVALKPEFQYQPRLIDSVPLLNRLNWKTVGSGIILVLVYFLVVKPMTKKSQPEN